MEALSVQQYLRPIRYGFVICADDSSAARKAASLNSVIWGGVFNPIIPTRPKEAMQGLLRTFDPDFLVDLTTGSLPKHLEEAFDDRVLRANEIVREKDDHQGRRRLQLGFGIGPVLWHIHENELHGGAKPSRCALATDVPEPWIPYSLFCHGGFDALPDAGLDYTAMFEDLVQATGVVFDPDAGGVDNRKWMFPLDMTRHGIRHSYGGGAFSSHIAYFGDHSNVNDLIEFWNIRATGRDAWFFPIAHYRKQRLELESILKAGRYKMSGGYENQTDVQKAPGITDDQFASATKWIKENLAEPVCGRGWSPRFGVSIDHCVGDIHAATLHAKVAEETTLFDGNSLTPIKLISPSFLDERRSPNNHRWAVDIVVANPYDANAWMCQLPKAGGLDRLLRTHVFTSGTVRLARRSLVLCQHFANETLSLSPFRTVNVINRILEHATGLKAKQSLPGRYAERIIQKMGSLRFDCRVFKIRGVREIVRMLSNGSKLTKGDMRQIVNSTDQDDFGQNWRDDLYDGLVFKQGRKASNFGGVFDFLLEKRIIRPGLKVSCDSCFASDWYHVSEVSEEITCRYCFERQRVKFGSAPRWQYKSDGLFRIQDSAEGSLAVILALWREI